MLDIKRLRADTSGCATRVHFNNAGAALMPIQVTEAMKSYIDLESVTGGYESSDLKAREIAEFYESLGAIFKTRARNIAFTSSATNSFSRALSAIPFEKGDHILIANEDYISNQITFLSMQDRLGIKLLRADSLPEGGVDLDHMKKLMDQYRPQLVSLSHIPTNTGLIQPAEEVGQLCREREILYLLDACQSVGQFPLDVNKLNCDFLTGTYRKFLRGPRGAGFLYVSDHVLSKPWGPLSVDMRGADWIEKDTYRFRDDARRFEDWELPYALVMGARAANQYALAVGLENILNRNRELCSQVHDGLKHIGLKTVDIGKHQSSIITVQISGWEPSKLLQHLRDLKINTSIASRSSAIIDFDAKGVSWALRISPHYYNTEEEVEVLVGVLGALHK